MWSLFEDKKGVIKELVPKKFSNGKTQEDVVNEVVSEIKKGRKVIFVHGVCGSGKSAMALNIARELGKASIVVPIKNLQRQYEKDYMQEKYVLKSNNQKLRISMITGRANHKCVYLQENKKEVLLTRMHEKDANLFNIFENVRKNNSKEIGRDESCDNSLLPCKIEIKQKNLNTLKKYYQDNPEAKNNKELDVKLLKRLAVAPACPYWSPILREDSKIKLSGTKKKYLSINGEQILYTRQEGCPYYQQFNSYIDSDVIIFNSDHYLLESALGRKPASDVEIIDECDEFLDSFSTEGSINLDKLRNELILLESNDEKEKKIIDDFIDDINGIQVEAKKYLETSDILPVNDTRVADFIKSIMNNDLFYDNRDDEGYMEHCFEVARDFYEILEDVYTSFTKDKNGNVYVKLVTVNLEKMLGTIIEKNKAFVFMSGTIHDETVLKEIFGLKDFKIIDAEVTNQGTITKQRTNFERDFSYDNLKTGRVNREQYLVALNKCVEIAKKPVVVHVNAFQDLPNSEEIDKYGLRNLISSQELIEKQNLDKEGKLVMEFKSGKTNVLFTTRCNRGIDFPFETCNSVVITKFPYPNTQGLFWRILKKNKPSFFWDFYKDKAHRELLQRIYRSVRAGDDHVFLLSPDLRVLETDVV
jgi:Rad3-related DNA helicase